MNRRILYCFLCMGWTPLLLAQPGPEQDTIVCKQTVKIFKVVKEGLTQPEQAPLLTDAIALPKELSVDDFATQPMLKLPTLSSDEKGLLHLLRLEPFSQGAKAPKDSVYVVFDFEVSEFGHVSEINIYDTNDRRMVDVLISKINRTRWNPAKNYKGENEKYKFDKWIAIVPSSVNEKDYESHGY